MMCFDFKNRFSRRSSWYFAKRYRTFWSRPMLN